MNLAVGQGDLQATPLQLATAYSTIVNGGRAVRPHLGMAIEDGGGRLVEEIRKPARRKVKFSQPTARRSCRACATRPGPPGGTSYDVFKNFPYPVYGKTGTAERFPNPDQSWYVAYVPHPTRPIVVVDDGRAAAASAPRPRHPQRA